jgi:hypothetical protein
MYTLRNKKTGKLIEIAISSNGDSDFANDVRYDLEVYGDQIWLVNSLDVIKKVYNSPSTKWYNSDYNSPCFSFNMKEYEIIEVTFGSENMRII